MPRFRPSISLLGLLLATALAVPAGGTSHAAELRVSEGGVIVEDGTAFVDVDVSWRLSWREETNWDAAWLVVKVPTGRGSAHVDPEVLPETVHVHGVEMVYIPEGSFSVGDPQGSNGPQDAFFRVMGGFRAARSAP